MKACVIWPSIILAFFAASFHIGVRVSSFLGNNSKVSFMINNCKISPPHVVNMIGVISPYMKNLALSCVESHAPSIRQSTNLSVAS